MSAVPRLSAISAMKYESKHIFLFITTCSINGTLKLSVGGHILEFMYKLSVFSLLFNVAFFHVLVIN